VKTNGYCTVEHGSLYFETEGDGSPVVFIQGFGLNTRYWDAVLPLLAGEFQIVRYDRRGFGQSTFPLQGHPYSDYEDLRLLLDHLGLEQVKLVAGCVGCHVALEFALEYPRRVAAMVLSNPDAGPGVAGVNEAFFKLVEDTRTEYAAGNLADAINRSLVNPILAPSARHPDVRFNLVRAMADFRGWQFLHWYPRRSCDPPVSGRMQDVQAPTLVLTGGREYRYFQKVGRVIADMIPGAWLETIDDAGHYAFLEFPGPVVELVLPVLLTEQRA
jgi:pimeloyl-ACP methyl ester carboxylesterase